MRQVREDDILRAISNVAGAIGMIDAISDFVDSKPASVLRKYRGWLANTVGDMQEWLEDDYIDEYLENARQGPETEVHGT